MSWTVVVPVKVGHRSKSRLGAPSSVAAAFAADCLAAVAACPVVRRVVVVTDRPVSPGEWPVAVQLVSQPTSNPGLPAAIRHGLALASGPSAVLLADLPALRPQHLQEALTGAAAAVASGAGSAFVPDAEASGSVLLAGPRPFSLPARFGPASARAHTDAGALTLPGAPGLRRDVDTAAELWQAWDLGVGPHTAATLTRVQVTVLTFDPVSSAGEVVTDDGIRLPLPASALVDSGLRLLRPGQRLSALVHPGDAGDQVVAVRLHGIGSPLPS